MLFLRGTGQAGPRRRRQIVFVPAPAEPLRAAGPGGLWPAAPGGDGRSPRPVRSRSVLSCSVPSCPAPSRPVPSRPPPGPCAPPAKAGAGRQRARTREDFTPVTVAGFTPANALYSPRGDLPARYKRGVGTCTPFAGTIPARRDFLGAP